MSEWSRRFSVYKYVCCGLYVSVVLLFLESLKQKEYVVLYFKDLR